MTAQATGGSFADGARFGAITGFVTGATYGTVKGLKEFKANRAQTRTRVGSIAPIEPPQKSDAVEHYSSNAIGDKNYYASDAFFSNLASLEDGTPREYAVYMGMDGEVVKYVGITKRELNVRWGEHKRSGGGKSNLTWRALQGAENLNLIQARVWEQTMINTYKLQKYGVSLIILHKG